MANMFHIGRAANKITLGTTDTTINVASHTASLLLSLNADKDLTSVGDLTSWIAGTANQIIVTDDTDGTITLSTPQDIHATASPTFAGLSLGTGELTCGSINRAAGTLTLEIAGTPQISITNTTVTFAGAVNITGVVTLTDNIIIPDAGWIGSVTTNEAIQIASTGNVTIPATLKVTGDVEVTGNILFQVNNAGIGYTDNSPMLVFNNTDDRVELTGAAGLAFTSAAGVITQNTTDGSDNAVIQFCGGGVVGNSRGGYCNLFGNEHATAPGCVEFVAGNVTGGVIKFYTDNNQERVRIDKAGLTTLYGNLVIPDDGYMGSASAVTAIQIEADGDLVCVRNVTAVGELISGVADTTRGYVRLYGGASGYGGTVYLQTAGDADDDINQYMLATYQDDFVIADDTIGDIIKITGPSGRVDVLTTLFVTNAITASNYTAANLLTACATNAGALDFSAASKTLTVEDNAIVSQDYTADASPTFAGLSLGTGELTCGSINRAAGTLTLEVGGAARLSLSTTVGLNVDLETDRWLDSDTNTLIGIGVVGAGNLAHTAADEGYQNTAVGNDSLYSNTTGWRNTVMGFQALYSNTTGWRNTALGYYALQSNTGGYYNTALGSNALQSNIGGYRNTAVGYWALRLNTTGFYNVALGADALSNNVGGSYNSAFGYFALRLNTAGQYNSAIGSATLYSNKTGNYNSAIGYEAMYSNTDGSSNSALGYWALRSNTTGGRNMAMGYKALYANTTGFQNIAIGYETLDSMRPTSGAITAFADNGDGKTLVTSAIHGQGNGVVVRITGTTNYNDSHTIEQVDTNTFVIPTAYVANDAIGWWGILSEGQNNCAIGSQAGYSLTTGSSNLFLGREAGYRQTTNDNLLIIDNRTRANIATELTNSILYGVMAAAVADQSLRVNGLLSSSYGAKLGDGGATDYTQVDATGNVTFAGAAGFYPRFLTQADEPAAGTGATQCDTSELVIWKDSDDNVVSICFNDGGTVKTIALA